VKRHTGTDESSDGCTYDLLDKLRYRISDAPDLPEQSEPIPSESSVSGVVFVERARLVGPGRTLTRLETILQDWDLIYYTSNGSATRTPTRQVSAETFNEARGLVQYLREVVGEDPKP
jgi:hypothetical protein